MLTANRRELSPHTERIHNFFTGISHSFHRQVVEWGLVKIGGDTMNLKRCLRGLFLLLLAKPLLNKLARIKKKHGVFE